jgi:hypothetical protein
MPSIRRPARAFARSALLLVSVLLLPVAPSIAGEPKTKHVAGWVETIRLEPWGKLVKAKLDTGAQTSSIHAHKIQRFKRKGESWVRFELVLDYRGKEIRVPDERPVTKRVLIKAAGRPHDSRVAVDLEFCFDGRRFRGPFTLANRETMLYPVLLGRSFLEGRILVDSGETYLTEPGCKPKAKAPTEDDPDGKDSESPSPKATQVESSSSGTEAEEPEDAAPADEPKGAAKPPKAGESRD